VTFLLPLKKQSKMSKKLWVEHITATNTFGPTRVSIDGCEYVDDLLEEIKKKSQLSIPQNTPITLYKPDGTTKIDVGDSPAKYLKENARGNPLIVRIVEMAHNTSIEITPKPSPSKVASILRSSMTIEEKESILTEFLQSKEREVEDKVLLFDALKEKNQRVEAERDFVKGTLDARHIFEVYELRFSIPNPKAPRSTRAEKWKNHLKVNPNILKKLEACIDSDEKILWQDKAVEIYGDLCRNIHQRTIDIGNGNYILMIEKSLPKISSCFVKVLATELYGESVQVQEVGI